MSWEAGRHRLRLEMEHSDELHRRLGAAMDGVLKAQRAIDQAVTMQQFVSDCEIDELRGMALDWQRQFHQLETLMARLGWTTGYGERGEVTVARSF